MPSCLVIKVNPTFTFLPIIMLLPKVDFSDHWRKANAANFAGVAFFILVSYFVL